MWALETATSPHGEEEALGFRPGNAAATRLKRFEQQWAPRKTIASNVTTALFDDEDFHDGKILGQGSFSTVYAISLRDGAAEKAGCFKREISDHTYAMKRLKPSVLADPTSSEIAASDLALEATILMNLRNENIIQLHGIKAGDAFDALKEGTFFIVLDLLVETLDVRLAKWRKNKGPKSFFQRSHVSSFFKAYCVAAKLKDVSLGIAKGMAYLHSKGLIFRDLKPSNIGFDETGQVKLFDFGLARDCAGEGMAGGKPRLMTGGAGTLRYMSPEVHRMDRSYGFPADVYSFSILLWELVTNRVPFAGISSPITFVEKVIKCNRRPDLKYVQLARMKSLLECSWSSDPKERPDFETICEDLDSIIREYEQFLANSRRGRNRLFRSVSDPGSSSLATLCMKDMHIGDYEPTAGSNSNTVCSSSESRSYNERLSFRWRRRSKSTPVDLKQRGVSCVASRSRANVSRELTLEVKNERIALRRRATRTWSRNQPRGLESHNRL